MVADSLIADTTARIFADLADPRTVNAAHDDAWKEKVWRALVDAGLPLLWVPEEAGGIGASFVEGLAALEAAGAKACAVPLAETMAGAWLLARAGLQAPTKRLALLPPGLRFDEAGRLWGHGGCRAVRFWRRVPGWRRRGRRRRSSCRAGRASIADGMQRGPGGR